MFSYYFAILQSESEGLLTCIEISQYNHEKDQKSGPGKKH